MAFDTLADPINHVKSVVANLDKASWDFPGNSWGDEDRYPLSKGKYLTPGDVALLQKLGEPQELSSAVSECANVRAVLKENSVEFGPEPVKRIAERRKTMPDTGLIAFTYLPAVSDDGRTALIIDGRSWGPLAAVALVVKLERQPDGGWRAVKSMILWEA